MKLIKLIILVLLFSSPMEGLAAETDNVDQIEIQDELMEEFDFSEIDDFLESVFPEEKLGFGETVIGLISGEIDFSVEMIKDLLLEQFTYEIQNSRAGIIQILILVIVAAIFSNFSEMFKGTQVSEISFTMLYMFLVIFCLSNFQMLADSAIKNIGQLTRFMEVLSPVYFIAVTLAKGSVTSVSFYQLILFFIYLIEMLILSFLLPLTRIYVIVRMISEMSSEIQLSKFGELLETIVSWSLKTLFAGVVGLNVVQGLLSPAIDTVKRSVLTRGGEMLPVIGDAIGGVTEIVLGTAVLIKNGIGVAGMLICVMLSLAPIIQMGITALMYQLITALIQPISDKKMVNCVSCMADGVKLLLRIVFTTSVLFLITMAVVTTRTGG